MLSSSKSLNIASYQIEFYRYISYLIAINKFEKKRNYVRANIPRFKSSKYQYILQ